MWGKKHAAGAPLEWRDALAKVLERVEPLPAVRLPLLQAFGSVCAKTIKSKINVPPFDNTGMDGFAIHAEDSKGATPETPRRLRVVGTAAAGTPFIGNVGEQEAVEIMTGAPMPAGADAVIRVEWSHPADNPQVIELLHEVPVGASLRRAGADTAAGNEVVQQGTVLTAGALGLLASCGEAEADVVRRPRVALCVGGDELRVPGSGELRPGQIFESNAIMLEALFRSWGAEVQFLGYIPDDPAQITPVFRDALEYDFLVSVGGVSMGERDYVQECFMSVGFEEVFWRVNQQPGGPLLFAKHPQTGTIAFGLPGNPVSCYFCSDLYVHAALAKASGATDYMPRLIAAKAAQELKKPHTKTSFLRAKLCSSGVDILADTTGPQDSNIIRSIANHDGYIIFPREKTVLSAGEPIDFLLSRKQALAKILPAKESL